MYQTKRPEHRPAETEHRHTVRPHRPAHMYTANGGRVPPATNRIDR